MMSYDDVINNIQMLAQSQGFYGRLYRAIENMRTSDIEAFEEFKHEVDEKFNDVVDMILYFET